MLQRAMVEVGAEPENTVMVGDTSYDMKMARAARTGALGVAWGYHPVSELTEAGAHTVIDAYEALVVAAHDWWENKGE